MLHENPSETNLGVGIQKCNETSAPFIDAEKLFRQPGLAVERMWESEGQPSTSCNRRCDWDAPGNAEPDRPPSPAPDTPPTKSLPSVPRRFSVSSSSSSSAPSVATERLRIQLAGC